MGWDRADAASAQPPPPVTPAPETKRPALAVTKQGKEEKKVRPRALPAPHPARSPHPCCARLLGGEEAFLWLEGVCVLGHPLVRVRTLLGARGSPAVAVFRPPRACVGEAPAAPSLPVTAVPWRAQARGSRTVAGPRPWCLPSPGVVTHFFPKNSPASLIQARVTPEAWVAAPTLALSVCGCSRVAVAVAVRPGRADALLRLPPPAPGGGRAGGWAGAGRSPVLNVC